MEPTDANRPDPNMVVLTLDENIVEVTAALVRACVPPYSVTRGEGQLKSSKWESLSGANTGLAGGKNVIGFGSNYCCGPCGIGGRVRAA